jgi:hypothetical protein
LRDLFLTSNASIRIDPVRHWLPHQTWAHSQR